MSSSATQPVVRAFKDALRPCPICLAARVEVLHTQKFEMPATSRLPLAYDVVACPACGMVYADTPVAQEQYDAYYAESSRYEDPAVATGGGASELDRRRLSDLGDRIAAEIPTNARVLDVGCAGGGLLAALAERGFGDLSGTDAAEDCVRQVADRGFSGHRLPLSRLGELRNSGPFDLVVLSHVLEHVVNVRRLVHDARTLTRAGGRIYVETPDADAYLDHPHVPFYFFDPEHINHFDVVRLSALAETAGLSVEGQGRRVLEVAPEKTYPACFVWMRCAGRAGPAAGRDSVARLRDRIAEYVRSSCQAGEFPELEALASAGTPVVVWGAGSFAQRLLGAGRLTDCRIVAVVDRDRNKQGRDLAGFRIEAPEAALERHPEATVLVAAAIADAEIVAEIRLIRGVGGSVVTLTPRR